MENELKQTRYAIFNKHNGLFFAYETDKVIADGYSKDNFLVKEITLRPFEYYYGDYYTGKVYSEEEKPFIREDEMEENFYQSIINQYSLVKQILIIVGVLETNKDIVKTDSFNEFAKFVRNKKIRYDQSLEVVKNDKESFNFMSLEDIDNYIKKRSEGIL